jgi:hypothetical protein
MKHNTTVLYLEQLSPETTFLKKLFPQASISLFTLRSLSLYTSSSFDLFSGVVGVLISLALTNRAVEVEGTSGFKVSLKV